MSESAMLYRSEDWPHGVRCGRCETLFEVEGAPMHHTLEAMFEDGIPIMGVLCGLCLFAGDVLTGESA